MDSSSGEVDPLALEVDPADIEAGSHLLIDIRPLEERRAELGWIPASLALAHAQEDASAPWLRAQLADGETAVLYCTSGRRSQEALAALQPEFPRPLAHLRGGVLAWTAAGLPTCGLLVVEPPPFMADLEHPSQFRQALTSCFVSVTMERSLSAGEYDADPMDVLRRCYDAEDVSWEDPSLGDLYRLIDRMGLVSRRLGSDLATIVENTNVMMGALDRLAARLQRP